MLHASGIICIDTAPENIKSKNGNFFQFIGKSKHPRETKFIPHKISIFVPFKSLSQAIELLQPGKYIYIRTAEVEGWKSEESKSVTENIRTSWQNIEILDLK